MKSTQSNCNYTSTTVKPDLHHQQHHHHQNINYGQSFSGSETDVSASTSTENLTHEEKYVLRNSTRQDPQGEETLSNRSGDLSCPSSPFNTLIIHKSQNSRDSSINHNPLYISENSMQRKTSTTGSPHPPSVHLRQSSRKPPIVPYDRSALNLLYQQSNLSQVDSSKNSESMAEMASQYYDLNNKDAAGDHLVQHHYNPTHLPPAPPSYPKWRNFENSCVSRRGIASSEKSGKGKGKMNISRSQPDLTQIGMGRYDEHCLLPQRPRTRGRAVSEVTSNEMAGANAPEMIVLLTKENLCLKAELDSYYSKISKLPKLEIEIQNVHRSYEDLVKSCERREQLARAVQVKYEMEIKRLQEVNRDLLEQLDIATSHLSKRPTEEFDDLEFRKELNRRDVLIAQLIAHNKELVAAKERQEIELSAQRATLQEQRTHIDILDSALTNAQANVVKVEEESRKKQAYVERVSQLQNALAALQSASDKREKMEKRLRNQLEKEILDLRSNGSNYKGNDESSQLKQQLRENEEKLMSAQTEVAKWEQRYLEESALRQIAIDAAAMPKDAKIAALERTSQENERVIAQARSEKLKQMDDMHSMNKKCADLDSKIKDLESKLAEKDAMIKVLQRHSIEKDMAYQNAIIRSPRHTPHPSLHSQLTTQTLNEEPTDNSSKEASCSVIPAVASALSSLAETRSGSTSLTISNSDASSNVELKNLDSQMFSKDSIIQALRAEKEKYPSHFWRV